MEEKKMFGVLETVEKLLSENNIWCEVFSTKKCGIPLVGVEIDHGDWKHDHGRADYLIENELHGMKISSEVTWEDGSDCYSANHYYFFSMG